MCQNDKIRHMINKNKNIFFLFLIWIYPLKEKKPWSFVFGLNFKNVRFYHYTDKIKRKSRLVWSTYPGVMTGPVQYTYNRCQFVTRSWSIYAMCWARLLYFFLDSRSKLIHQIKNAHYFTYTIIWFTGKKNILSAANFKVFCLNFFYLLVHVFH